MGLTEKLEMLVTLDPSAGVRGLDTLAKKAEDTGKSVESSWSKIGASAMKLGAAGLGAGVFLTAMADADKQSLASLKASIEQTGGSYSDFSDRIDETISKQAEFAHTDGEVTHALGILTTAYGDTGKAIDRMQLVADLAAKKHINLAEAADLVAKVHDGSTKALKGFDIQLGTNADGTKNYEGALDQLSQKLSGQASASVEGFTGWLKVQRAELENVISDFGAKYGPAITAGSAALTAFGAVSSGVGAVHGKLTAALAATAAAETGTATAAGVAAIALSSEAVAATAAWTAMLGPAAIALVLGEALTHLGDDAQQTGMSVKDFTEGLKTGTITGYGQGIDIAVTSLKDLGSQMAAISIPTALRYADALDAADINTDELRSGINAFTNSAPGAVQAEQNLTDATNRNVESTKAQSAALKELNDAVHASIDPVFGLVKASLDNKQAQEAATAAQKDGTKSAEEKVQADLRAAESAMAVTTATNTLKAGLMDGTVKITEANNQLRQMADAGLITQDQLATLTYVVGGYTSGLNAIPTDVTTNLHLNITAAEQALHTLAQDKASIGGFAEGGMVPGRKGQARLAVVHGGEFVMTTAEVDAAKNGGGGSSGSGVNGNQGAPLTVYLDARGSMMTGAQVIDALHNHARTNTAPVALKEWFAA